MNSLDRKKISVITKYAVDSFSESDWYTLGQITGKLRSLNDHSRLFRSLSFQDPDYESCAVEVLHDIFSENVPLIADVIDHFDIDLWYQQKDPEKWRRIFGQQAVPAADFWKDGYLKLFVSHITSGKAQASNLRTFLGAWGISAFVAKDDIQPSREWRLEVEAALETMEVMVPVVESGFKESDWCAQEVGFALGRKIEIIPLCLGWTHLDSLQRFKGSKEKGRCRPR